MLKKLIFSLIMFILLIGICENVFATDTTTSTINGITVNWSYTLNESNEITNLKCTNPEDITGDITIPATLDEKTVVSLSGEAFKSSTGLTGVTIPDSVKEIYENAFLNCENLTSVNLGQIELIKANAFKNCPKLETITIPKTLVTGPAWPSDLGVFTGTTNLTSVNFEDGTTIIASGILNYCEGITQVEIPNTVTRIGDYAFANSGLTNITMPDSVKEIHEKAFLNCENLTSVNLGQIELVKADAFKNCPKLKTITIPKTLVTGPAWPSDLGVFTGTTNLTSANFEEGTTIIASGILNYCEGITQVEIPNTVTRIGDYAFANSGLTNITMPDSVKEIHEKAFLNCENLTSVNLGQIELVKADAFKNCPKLKTITIPKTLVTGPAWPSDLGVFTGTTNLTSANFEEGTTIIASGILNYCEGITQVEIPNTVTRIGDYAFANSGLTNITMSDSVKEIHEKAFLNCENLTSVNLGKIELIKVDAFKNCPKLKTITIPKTLVTGPAWPSDLGVFTGTTNLTSANFEEGTTIIASGILNYCEGITQIELPNTVTRIGDFAFANSGLTNITMSDSLKEIYQSAFLKCKNLTSIDLGKVELIKTNAFGDCENLVKVTILDNCESMASNIFRNHNDELTIYCYEDSVAAKYAIDNQIKYVYLTKPSIEDDTDKEDEKNDNTGESDLEKPSESVPKPSKPKDPTVADGELPQTGESKIIIFSIILAIIIAVVMYKKFVTYKDIK